MTRKEAAQRELHHWAAMSGQSVGDVKKQYASARRKMKKKTKPQDRPWTSAGEAWPKRRKNPTKAQKREKAKKASVKTRVANALAKFLHQANPAMKTSGATVTRLKGGGFTIRPIKAARGRR
jgi:hypothetical protein